MTRQFGPEVAPARGQPEGANALPLRSPSVQLKRELAGLSYAQQLERVRPSQPLHAPVQRQEAPAGPAPAAPVQMVTPEAAGDDRNTKVAKYKGYLDSKGIPNSQAIAELVQDGITAKDAGKFKAAAALVPLDALPAGRPLCLWSGEGCKALAESTGVELNTTKVGKLASDWKFLGATYPDLFPLWCAVSARFVESAKGEVHIFLGYSKYDKAGGIRGNSVFGSTEKKALEDLAAARPELAIKTKYHSVAAVHNFADETITSTVEGVPVSDTAAGVPEPKSLYWVTGDPGHVGKPITCYIRPYDRDGKKVKGHLRGV